MNEIFTLNDAIRMFTEVNASQKMYWNIYVSVTLAVLAFIGTNYAKRQSRTMFIYIALGYLIFVVANAFEIYLIQKRIVVISHSIINYVAAHQASIDKNLLPVFDGFPILNPMLVLLFHLTVGVITLALIAQAFRVKIKADSDSSS